jgi:hypothetical protein
VSSDIFASRDNDLRVRRNFSFVLAFANKPGFSYSIQW